MSNACILLSTYNGEKYLCELMNSILLQNVDIIIRDDGSTDNTMEILKYYQNMYPKGVHIMTESNNLGVACSFITLLKYAVAQGYEYYFFCDQDDVWLSNKCSRALERMVRCSGPALYFSRKRIVDSNLETVSEDVRIDYTGEFWDCFKHSNVYGCTICMNKALSQLVIKNNFEGKKYLHDAFIYRLAIVIDAEIVNDEWESVLYRQHDGNVIGAVNRQTISTKLSKENNHIRLHYMQNMLYDMKSTYSDNIPDSNMKLIELIIHYTDSLKDKVSLLGVISLCHLDFMTKMKISIKTLMGVL